MFALKALSAAAAVALVATPALGQLELFDGSTDAGIFSTEVSGFTFLDFDGAVTETGSSFIINADTDIDGANGIFGGVGRDLVNGIVDFNTATNQLLVEFRFLPGDTAGTFNAILTDVDSINPDGSFVEDQFQFGLGSASQAAIDNGFIAATFNISETDSQFTQGGGDLLANFGLRQFQIQSGFGSPETLNLEVRRVAIIGDAVDNPPIPEPASAALLALGATALLGRRRREA